MKTPGQFETKINMQELDVIGRDAKAWAATNRLDFGARSAESKRRFMQAELQLVEKAREILDATMRPTDNSAGS
jgi:hypothetical protein